MTPNPPRIEPLPEAEWDAEATKLLGALRRDGKVYNIFTTLARHPELMKRWLVFGTHILSQSALPARDREIAILRTGWLCRAKYEWGHHVPLGRQAGLSDEDIRRCSLGPDAPGWTPFEAALVRAADELHANSRISDDTWRVLAGGYDTRQLMDLVFTVGQYTLVSMALNSFGVQLEPGYEAMPDAT